jgi:hypothetical protein
MSEARLEAALAAFDEANSADPNRIEAEGTAWPKELLYGRQMIRAGRVRGAETGRAMPAYQTLGDPARRLSARPHRLSEMAHRT